MSPIEIIFVCVGLLLLLVSCFVTGKKEDAKEAAVVPLPAEMTKEQKQKLEEEIDHILEERTDYLVIKADDYLSKVSNEKIMAVNDFTAQIMEKINGNHQEVVFLYDMLNQKEAELKEAVQKFEEEKKSLKEAAEDVVHLTKQLNAIIKRSEAKAALPLEASAGKAEKEDAQTEAAPAGKQGKASEKNRTKKAARAEAKAKTATSAKQDGTAYGGGQIELPEMMHPDNRSEEILKLYRQGKGVLEISKALGLGQGEVKLVIDLYGPM